MMDCSNLGKFSLDELYVRGEPEEVAAVFAIMKCVPVRAEFMFGERRVEYTAIAEVFEAVPTGTQVPWYTLRIDTNEAGWPVGVVAERDPETR